MLAGSHGVWLWVSGRLSPRSGSWWPFSTLTLSVPFPLPQPPTQSLALGPGGLSQSGSGQGLHSQGSLSDAIGAGLPPPSLMQAQIGNGERPWARWALGWFRGATGSPTGLPGGRPPRWGPSPTGGPAAGAHARGETRRDKALIPGPLRTGAASPQSAGFRVGLLSLG